MLLVGDIGGTKTILAVIDPQRGSRNPLAKATFANADFASLDAVIDMFLRDIDIPIRHAVMGVAGPVEKGPFQLTNLPWVVDAGNLRRKFKLRSVRILNDLEATAAAVPHLLPEEVFTLLDGEVAQEGNMAVLAPGTGLGEAFITWEGGNCHVHASEGGHADFGPRNALQRELLGSLQERFDHVGYEMVCSGPGIARIYEFLKKSNPAAEPPWLSDRLRNVQDPTPVIVEAALDRQNPVMLCLESIGVFVSILAAEAGNLALKVLATRGVYLAGGIIPRILPILKKNQFEAAFRGKGKLSAVLLPVPVYVILNTGIVLLGAGLKGLRDCY
ncbi:MAG: glucokinase [Deltaproteobacteria bacterium]|nr:glucokinase [Deltaproteobacteria bacterium]